MQPPAITISIVTYRTNVNVLSTCLDSIARITVPFVCYIVDNAQDRRIQALVESVNSQLNVSGRLAYLPNENTGYGVANNRAIQKAMDEYDCPFHLVMNPDITFAEGTVESMLRQMHHNETIGLLSPRIVFPDGRLQRLCKLLPTPGRLFLRRFAPFAAASGNAVYQLEFADDQASFDCPNLSGCFMLVRMKTLRQVGLFDERFFLYFEDVDLVRRIGQSWRTVYWPHVRVVHAYEKASYSNPVLLLHHIASAVKYFNKWGWIFDGERKKVNHETQSHLPKKERQCYR